MRTPGVSKESNHQLNCCNINTVYSIEHQQLVPDSYAIDSNIKNMARNRSAYPTFLDQNGQNESPLECQKCVLTRIPPA